MMIIIASCPTDLIDLSVLNGSISFVNSAHKEMQQTSAKIGI